MWATLVKHPDDRRRRSCALFHARFDPRLGGDAERAQPREARRSSPRIEAALQHVASLDEDRILRRFVNAVRRRSAHQFLPARRRTASRSRHRHQVRQPQARRPAAAACRSTRSSSIRRASRACTCASARSRAAASAGPTGRRTSAPRCWAWSRRSRSRTPSSCRSAPRAASCRSSCRARRARARRSQAEGIAAYKHLHLSAARHHRQSRRTTRCVPPPDVVRHDGDDPYLVVAADKGTATFSDIANAHRAGARLLARRRLRLGRLGRLRPQEDGHHRARRLGSGEAPFPRDGHRHPDDAVHAWSASATCRATCSATACCCRTTDQAARRLRPPRHLHRSRSRSGKSRSPSASACSTCRARAGRTTTRR